MKNIYSFPLLLIGLVVSSGCSKYLEQLPDQRTGLNTPGKVSELLVSAYPGANYITFCEAMSDNVGDNFGMGTTDQINTNSYFWRDIGNTNQDSPIYYWNNAYAAIAAANLALEAINNAPDPENYQARKGEALVARAYSHFMLVSLFAKFYNPATADTDPGIPYVTEPETVVWKDYERHTVSYVYEQIEKDLTEGLPLINDNVYSVPSYHFTRRAANSFAVRFYLFKREPEKVIEHANRAFPSNNFVSNMRALKTKYRTVGSEEFSILYTQSAETANILLCETTSWWARRFRQYRYSVPVNLRDRILQQTIVGNLNAYRTWSMSGLSYYVRKFTEHYVRTGINATTGRGYVMVPLFSTEEVLLSRAEAHALSGNSEAALADLNTFVRERVRDENYNNTHVLTEARIAQYFYSKEVDELSAVELRDGLVRACLEMRRAEFLHEGLRWFDILRYDIPVTHTTVEGQVNVLPSGDLRRVLQLPEEVTLSGMELNPR